MTILLIAVVAWLLIPGWVIVAMLIGVGGMMAMSAFDTTPNQLADKAMDKAEGIAKNINGE